MRNSKKNFQKVAKLVFDEKVVYHQKLSRVVTVKVIAHIQFIDSYDRFNYFDDIVYPFETVGIAYCSPDDQFDPGKGYKIASARAENEAYNVASQKITKLVKLLGTVSDSLDGMLVELKENRQHNRHFEGQVIEGTFKSKRELKSAACSSK